MLHSLSRPEPDTRTTKIQTRRAERRDRIIACATELAVLGYDACQIRSVTAAAGVSAGTVYQYFPSKDDLLLACFYEWLWDFETEYRCPTNDPDPFQRLLQVSLTLTDRLCSSPQFAEAMIRPYLYADGTAAIQADLVRRQTVQIFIRSVGGIQSAAREIGAAEILSDVWMSNVAAFTQQRIAVAELTERLTRTVGLLKRR
ncbi:TetR/AcrR family transcriptional regulator [Mycolicibacterium neworleansense]|uniref:TetR family transcriptional regulator n=1 Tax=Mycolicibacterium neworleansense TaxID=146018 RepID=A0A0H5RSN2_9MYCO|nr:TetR family transcriptional regulator [Mycolicibacterium neworleansense]MCV7365801.1 TetR family transcriptional regulator [Mycolicibacterium neworleansense]CRZ16502.1 TetR family transcriptional regulator [Mycolicibacterium neworleansense]